MLDVALCFTWTLGYSLATRLIHILAIHIKMSSYRASALFRPPLSAFHEKYRPFFVVLTEFRPWPPDKNMKYPFTRHGFIHVEIPTVMIFSMYVSDTSDTFYSLLY